MLDPLGSQEQSGGTLERDGSALGRKGLPKDQGF